jgi:hypothetical protein
MSMTLQVDLKMKAWSLTTPALVDEHPRRLAEIPVKVPAEDELLLRVSASGI